MIKRFSSNLSSPLFREPRTQLQTTCHALTYVRKSEFTSNFMTKYQSSTSILTWHQNRPNRTTKRRTTYLTTTPPPRNKLTPSMPFWTRSPSATTNRVDSFFMSIETIRHQITPIITGQHDEMTFTRFRRRQHDNVVNQVCLNGDFLIVQEQLVNSDVQRMLRILNQNETLSNHVNFERQFFQKLVKKRLEVVNNLLYRNFFDGTLKIKCKQIVVLPETIRQVIQSLHDDPLKGNPGCNKMLHEIRKRYYSSNLSELVLQYVSNCRDCIRFKSIRKAAVTPPLQQIYDPCNEHEDILEIDLVLVGELPPSNGFTHVLTACDYFSRYLFAVPIRKPDTQSVVEALLQGFT